MMAMARNGVNLGNHSKTSEMKMKIFSRSLHLQIHSPKDCNLQALLVRSLHLSLAIKVNWSCSFKMMNTLSPNLACSLASQIFSNLDRIRRLCRLLAEDFLNGLKLRYFHLYN